MRLNLAIAVTTERQDGRIVYKCSTSRGSICEARNVVLSSALAKVATEARKSIGQWIEEGKPAILNHWLYDAEMKGTVLRLVLTLRDRTIRAKLLMITVPIGSRFQAFATTVPGVVFELSDLANLQARAEEVYTHWCQARVKEEDFQALDGMSIEGDAWLECLEVEVETRVRRKRPMKNIFAALMGQGPVSGSEELNKVGQCLDYLVDEYQTAIGRQDIVDEIDHLLRRADRQGVLVIGPPAVGKTAILQECIKRRTERYRNKRGHKPQTWWISPQRLISGMMYLGQWEQRWLAILREATKRDHILYFEDLVGLYTAGLTRDSRLSAADVLKSYLSEQRVRIVGETTPEELAVLRRRDRSLADRFHLVHVPSLSASDTLPMLMEATGRVETQKKVFFHPGVVPLVIQQQEVLAPNRAFPGKAIELIKTLGDNSQVITPLGMFEHLQQRTGANLQLLLGQLGNQAHIENALAMAVIGQPDAVAAMARIVLRFTQKIQPSDRPVGVLLFLGPTGVGKTESAKALTELLFNDASHMIRIDMNELTTPMAAEQLVGTFDAPEGRLTSAVRRQPHSVVLLDEIEKAHPDVFDYLLQVLGEGRLTDARGRVVDFRSTIIILTSNLGATNQSGQLGFDGGSQRGLAYQRAAEQFFRPEFFNRIDEVIAFRALTQSDIEKIVLIQLRHLLAREGLKRRHVFVRIERGTLDHVVKVGFDKQLGARAVRRALEQEIVQPLGDQLSELKVDAPVLIRVSRQAEQLSCQTLSMHELPMPAAPAPRPNLETLVEQAKARVEQFEEQLAEASVRLKSDDSSGGNASKIAYYTLHEQVFHCNQLLKSARYRLTSTHQPRLSPMQGLPEAVRRNQVSYRGAGARRIMREWMADVDLRETVSKDDADPALLDMPIEALAEHLQRGLSMAQTMLDNVDQPRHWLLGMESLSRPIDETVGRSFRSKYMNYFMDPEIFFVNCLWECLADEWHYDVKEIAEHPNHRIISGVAVSGLLQAVAGTYVVEGDSKGRDLCALRALAMPDDYSQLRISDILAKQPVLSDAGFNAAPPGQAYGFDTIRGTIGAEIVDHASGQRMRLSKDWKDDGPTPKKWANWWLDTMNNAESVTS